MGEKAGDGVPGTIGFGDEKIAVDIAEVRTSGVAAAIPGLYSFLTDSVTDWSDNPPAAVASKPILAYLPISYRSAKGIEAVTFTIKHQLGTHWDTPTAIRPQRNLNMQIASIELHVFKLVAIIGCAVRQTDVFSTRNSLSKSTRHKPD